MKQLLIWAIVIFLCSQSALNALAFDKEKLMALDPLCSQRIVHQANDYQNNRFWGSLGVGVALLGIIWNNSGSLGEDAKLGNIAQGIGLLATGGILYYTDGDPVIQKDTLMDLNLSGIEKEEVSYSILKYNAVRSRLSRTNSSMILMSTGIGVAGLAFIANKATQSYKDVLYTGAALYFIQGLWNYLNPKQNEKDMEKIDKEIGAN